jgi:hypothetical protein
LLWRVRIWVAAPWTRWPGGWCWSSCPSTARTCSRRKQDQASAGAPNGERYLLGRILVRHPGHPLAGRVLPVVRRYREHGERLWVIELPDGSRQYVPASWCAPLVSSQTLPIAGDPSVGRQPPAPPVSPLSRAALRDLAALVRHLRERGEPRGEEHADDPAIEPRDQAEPHRDRASNADNRDSLAGRPASLGEFPARGSLPIGERNRPDRAPPDPEPATGSAGGGTGVRER